MKATWFKAALSGVLLTLAVAASPLQAAPMAGVAEAPRAAAEQSTHLTSQVHWRRHHRWHRHHSHRRHWHGHRGHRHCGYVRRCGYWGCRIVRRCHRH